MKLKYIIDKKYDQNIQDLSNPKVKKHFDKMYRVNQKYLKQARDNYQKAWDEINDKFSKYIEKETGYKWFYPTYYCVVSSIPSWGISNWGYEPKIVRGWGENLYRQRRGTAHELIISHYFEIYTHHYGNHDLSNGQIWALAEIAAFALTSLSETAKKFWPWDFSGYYGNRDYPQIIDLQKKLKNTFLKRKSFDEYIEKGIELVKKYPNIKP